MKTALIILVALIPVLPALGQEYGTQKPEKKTTQMGMKGRGKYLVTAQHTKEGCLQAMDEISQKSSKLLDNTWWGCRWGDHTSYMIVDAKSVDDARNMLPTNIRKNAEIAHVEQSTKDQIRGFHEETKAKMDKQNLNENDMDEE